MRYRDYYHFYEEDTEPQSSITTDTTDDTTTKRDVEPQTVDKEDTKSTTFNSQQNTLYPSQIQSIVKREVRKLMDLERSKLKQQSAPPQQKNPPIQNIKPTKHKSNSSKQKSGNNRGFLLSYERLLPININPNSINRFVPFNSKEVNSLLREHPMDLSIVSVCLGNRTPTVNMNLTLYLQFFLIKNNLPYIPLYFVKRGEILDIQFIVFGTDYLSNPQMPKLIGSYVLLKQTNKQWKFYYGDYKQSIDLKSVYYQSVINYYTQMRGIIVDKQSSFFVNPTPISRTEKYIRTTKKLEITLPT